jgi:hypothetical protein
VAIITAFLLASSARLPLQPRRTDRPPAGWLGFLSGRGQNASLTPYGSISGRLPGARSLGLGADSIKPSPPKKHPRHALPSNRRARIPPFEPSGCL